MNVWITKVSKKKGKTNVVSFRVVNSSNKDMITPAPRTEHEARQLAADHGYTVVGMIK